MANNESTENYQSEAVAAEKETNPALQKHLSHYLSRHLSQLNATNYLQHREHVSHLTDKAKINFAGHLSSFLGVNGLIFILNVFITKVKYPFFLYPLFAWGIGLAAHFLNVRMKARDKKELEKYPEISVSQYMELRRYQNSRRNFASHLGAMLGLTGLILVCYFLQPVSHPWPFYPLAVIGIGLGSHFSVFKAKARLFKQKFKALGRSKNGSPPHTGTPVQQGKGLMSKAKNLKENILTQLQQNNQLDSTIGEDIRPVLANYINQIEQLETRKTELSAFLNNQEHQNLDSEKKRLQQKREQCSSPSLKEEYEKSIEELERQQHSIRALHEQLELLDLRLNSSLTALNQLHLDLIRMKNLPETGERASITMLKKRSRELSDYLEDLDESYNELR